jgi:long-chain acyl-CoA synthetase
VLTQPRGNSLGRLAEDAEERFGEQSVLVFEGSEHSMRDLGARARRFAGGLQSLGVRRGDRVAVCMANCPEVVETYRAVWRIGAVVTPLLFLLSEDELRHALLDSGAAAVVTTPEFWPKISAASAGLELHRIVTGPAGTAGVSYTDLAAGDEAPLVDIDPGELAALLYTGGTTGRAKGVMLSHDALSSAAWAATLAGEDDAFAVSLIPLPLAHAYGLLVSTLGLHAVRPSRSVLMRWFEPAAWLRLAQDERVEVSGVVPTMLRLLAAQPLEDYDLSALRRLVSGSAPLPAEIGEQWARRVPHVELVEGYGCSETAALATTTPSGQARPGSVGRAAPGVDVRIELPDGSTAPPGVDGEVCLRPPSLMTGYWNDPAATAHAVRDGWFHTGDVGHLDADGYLFLVDRLKDLIIRNGVNVYPRDIEEALIRHPDVAVCAVIGRPHDVHGEEVVAFVELRAGATTTAAELVNYAREHISAAKFPREVHVVDQVPLTSVGKLDRKALRTRL